MSVSVSVRWPWWTNLYLGLVLFLDWLGLPMDFQAAAHRVVRHSVDVR